MQPHRSRRATTVALTALATLTTLATSAGCSLTRDDGAAAPVTPPAAPSSTIITTPATPPAAGTQPARLYRDLAYASTSPAQKLDLDLPERTEQSGKPVPLVVNIHGGGWMEGDKGDPAERWNVDRLNADGIAVAGINYRLSGEAAFPAGVQDAKAALRWLRANAARYGIDPDRIALSGASAGGNIADLVGVTGSISTAFDGGGLGNPGVSSAVRAVVSLYGVSDLLTMDRDYQAQGCPGPYPQNDLPNSPESLWLGFPIQEHPRVTAKASPISYLRRARDVPPFHLVHGTADCTVPDAQSREFRRALKKAGVPVTLQLVPGAGHGDPKVFQAGADAAIDFLEQNLR